MGSYTVTKSYRYCKKNILQILYKRQYPQELTSELQQTLLTVLPRTSHSLTILNTHILHQGQKIRKSQTSLRLGGFFCHNPSYLQQNNSTHKILQLKGPDRPASMLLYKPADFREKVLCGGILPSSEHLRSSWFNPTSLAPGSSLRPSIKWSGTWERAHIGSPSISEWFL